MNCKLLSFNCIYSAVMTQRRQTQLYEPFSRARIGFVRAQALRKKRPPLESFDYSHLPLPNADLMDQIHRAAIMHNCTPYVELDGQGFGYLEYDGSALIALAVMFEEMAEAELEDQRSTFLGDQNK